MPVLEQVGRHELEAADAQLSKLQDALETAAHSRALDSEFTDRLNKTFREVAARLNVNLPPEIDAAASGELRTRLVGILTQDFSDLSSLDVADRFLIEMEAIRHIIRDVLQEQPPVRLRDASQAIELLETWLPGVTQAQLAELIGYSPRQLQRLRGEVGKAAPHRLQIVARLVAILRHAWTDQGVLMWFHRPRRELGDVAPVELLDDPGRERELVLAARSGRVQGGV